MEAVTLNMTCIAKKWLPGAVSNIEFLARMSISNFGKF